MSYYSTQIHVIRHMGGLPNNCHTCRFLDIDAVRLLCEFYHLEIPPGLSLILDNNLSASRKGTIYVYVLLCRKHLLLSILLLFFLYY